MFAKIIGGLGVVGGTIVIAVLLIGMLCIAPWLLFWSIETLFGIVIPFTMWNWLAAVVLLSLVRGGK